MRKISNQSSTASTPYQALQAHAWRTPSTEALRAKRGGVWQSHSWSELGALVRCTASHWSSKGVRPGDAVVAVGPLTVNLIVTMFAIDVLGATVEIADAAKEAALLAQARFIYAGGPGGLAQAMPPRVDTRAVIVNDDDMDSPAWRGGLASNGEPGGEAACDWFEDTASTRAAPLIRVHTEDGEAHAWARMAGSASWPHKRRIRVLADFDPTWSFGLRQLAVEWPTSDALLFLPEPAGHANVDRKEARCTLWLASPDHLASSIVDEASARWPMHGAGAPGTLTKQAARCAADWFARSRMRSALGLSRVRQLETDHSLDDQTLHALTVLHVLPRSLAAAVAAEPYEPAWSLDPFEDQESSFVKEGVISSLRPAYSAINVANKQSAGDAPPRPAAEPTPASCWG